MRDIGSFLGEKDFTSVAIQLTISGVPRAAAAWQALGGRGASQ
jgi:hypothetical protein